MWAVYGVLALGLAWHFLFKRGHIGAFVLASALSCLFFLYHLKQYARRSHGKRLEQRAITSLQQLISGKSHSHLTPWVPLPYGGDADALVVLEGIRFVLEIKAIESPQKVTAGHVAQASKAASALYGIAIVWLPASKVTQVRQKAGVHIVAGSPKALLKYVERLK
ncbi:MAG: hypothetical protein ACK5BY_02785 [Limnohabitans sp.]|uniref:hypothetical protein n=1 Tax=Limnohabitans sp. TaxID=1907725 RepID=UPI00391959FD